MEFDSNKFADAVNKLSERSPEDQLTTLEERIKIDIAMSTVFAKNEIQRNSSELHERFDTGSDFVPDIKNINDQKIGPLQVDAFRGKEKTVDQIIGELTTPEPSKYEKEMDALFPPSFSGASGPTKRER